MRTWKNVKKELLKDKKIAAEYKKLEPRYQLISDLIRTRIKKGLTQKQLAEKIGTKQSAIARLESGTENLSLNSIEKIAKVMDARLEIRIKK